MFKKVRVVVTAALLSITCASAAFAAGWQQDEKGYRFQNDSGSWASDQIMAVDGVNYAFDPQGYMVTGWHTRDGKWYYFTPGSGAMAYGWQNVEGKWYYLDQSLGGYMRTSWLTLGSKRYYLDANGVMLTGYFGVDGLAYRADENGVVYRNKSEEDANGNIYVYDSEGRIKFANTQTRNISKGEGGSAFQDFLPPEYFAEGKQELINQSREVIENKMDEQFVKYKRYMESAKNAKQRQTQTEDWKTRVVRALQELSVSQAEIDSYINQVLSDAYRPYGDLSDFDYDYDQDDEYDDEDYDEYDEDYDDYWY